MKNYRKFAAVLMLVSFIFATVSPASGEALEYIDAKKSASGTDGNASADGAGSLAAGYRALVSTSGEYSTALGNSAMVSGAKNSTAVGAFACISAGTAVNSTSLGYNSMVTAQDAAALGSYACATAANSVAIGFNSCASESDTVSVGNASCNTTRRIVNVAAGTHLTDAVNYSQIVTKADYDGGTLTLRNADNVMITSVDIPYGDVPGYIMARKALDTDGGAQAANPGSLAAGYRASASADFSVALGYAACAAAQSSTVVGAMATTGTNANSTSVGYWSSVSSGNGAAVGAYACATAANSVAIGFNSCASESDTVSVGNASCSTTRRIVNVKAGTSANDAATFGQLTNYTAVKIKNGETISDNITGSNGLVLEAGDNITLAADGANTIKISASGGGALWEAGTKTGSVQLKGGNNTAGGEYSVALGSESTAEGNYSLAAGYGAQTHGGSSLSAGAGTNADGYAAIALGQDTTAKTNAVALGYATKAVAKASTATGYGSEAYGEGSFAGGGHVTGTQIVGGKAYGESSFAFGTGAVAGHIVSEETTNPDTGEHIAAVYGGDYTFAFGLNANAGKDNAIALGKDTNAAGNASVAMGENTNADGENSTAVGYGTTASGQYSTAMSFGTTADGIASVSTGYGSAAAGSGSFAGGGYYLTDSDNKTGGTAYGKSSFAFGEKANASGEASVAFGKNTNASGEASTALGYLSTAAGNYSLAAGYGAQTHGGAAIAAGAGTNADGYAAIALGQDTTAKTNAVALGYKTKAVAKASTATGYGSEALGEGSFAGGGHVTSTQVSGGKAYGESSFAFGTGAVAGASDGTGNYTFAFGLNAVASKDNAIALGSSSSAGHANSVALGSSSVTAGEYEVSVGDAANNISRRLTNLAEGTSTNDAVNYGQFKKAVVEANYTGGVLTMTNEGGDTVFSQAFTSSGTIPGAVVYDNPDTKTKVTLNAGGGAVTVTNVADGTTDSDAVNYGQMTTMLGTKANQSEFATLQGTVGNESAGLVKDVSELQTTIGTKANAADLTAHANDSVSHVTAAERAKWNDYETAIGTINGSAAMKSGITAEKVAKYDGYEAKIDGKADALHTHDFTDMANKPTTLEGYGITNGAKASDVITSFTSTGGAVKAHKADNSTMDVAQLHNTMVTSGTITTGENNKKYLTLTTKDEYTGATKQLDGISLDGLSSTIIITGEGGSPITNGANIDFKHVVEDGKDKIAVGLLDEINLRSANFNTGNGYVWVDEDGISMTEIGDEEHSNYGKFSEMTTDHVTLGYQTNASDEKIYAALRPDTLTIDGHDYITTAGINANGKEIANVKAAEIAFGGNYAATTGQLYETNQNVAANKIAIDANSANIAANKTAIDEINDSVVMKSGITAEKVAKYDGYEAKINAKADKATTLSGYGITDAYTKTNVDEKVANLNGRIDNIVVSGSEAISVNKNRIRPEDKAASAQAAGSISEAFNSGVSANSTAGIAIGYGATVGFENGEITTAPTKDTTAENSIAIGRGSTVTGKNSIAIGTGHTVSGNNSGAFGDPTIINGDNSYAVGNNNTVTTNDTFVLGNNVTKTANNSVILGNGSEATEENTVSVGSAANQRRIVNVADGTAPTDAVNRRQLDVVRNELGSVSNEVREVGAISAALAGLHYAEPSGEAGDKLVGAVAYGGYRGAGAEAVGLAYKPSPNMMLSASTSISNGNDSQNAYNVGFSLKFGKGETAKTRAELQKQVKYVNEENRVLKTQIVNLSTENAEQSAKMAEQDARIQALEELVNKLLKK